MGPRKRKKMLETKVREGHQDDAVVSAVDAVQAERLEQLRQAQEQFLDWLYPEPDTSNSMVDYDWQAEEMLDLLLEYYEHGNESKATARYIDITVQWDCAISSLRSGDATNTRITHKDVQYGLRT